MENHPQHRILVAEDEPTLLAAICKKLEDSGYKTFPARSVDDAKKILESNASIEAIWLDHYLLGKQSGLDLLASLKTEDSRLKHIPIFVVSNTASPEKMSAYLQLGASAYYTKTNFRLDDIIQGIEEHLHKSDKK